ncbi:HAD family hydrolase [Stackebrandtia soli]|uniref:HAD family hydrolase n=1 Tax=Stackebrandtia soli TaxID=1892856 RepID=UPI0039EBD360
MDCPKLVVVDLDGTVVGYDTAHVAPSPAIIKALASVRAAGVPVAIATGRAVWGALRTVTDLGLTDGLVSATHGAVTYDLARDQVIDEVLIDPAEAVEALARADASTAFAVELRQRGWRHTANFSRDFESTWADVVDVDTLAATPTVRLAARVEATSSYGTRLRCPAATRLADSARIDESKFCVEVGFNGWIDIGAAGVTKATGVAAIAAHYGVDPADTIVFGDAANDLPMFAWAGHSVAMGQAVGEVQEAADEVAPSVYDDGVAVVLKRWFP